MKLKVPLNFLLVFLGVLSGSLYGNDTVDHWSKKTLKDVLEYRSIPLLPEGLPLRFDDAATVNYSFVATSGGTLDLDLNANLIANNETSGINSSTTYLVLGKLDQATANAGIGVELANPLNFSNGTTLILKVRSENGDLPLSVRLEDTGSPPDGNGEPSIFVEITTTVPLSKTWEELVLDIGAIPGFDPANSYDRITFVLNPGITGSTVSLDVDDIALGGSSPAELPPLPEADQVDVVSVFSDTYSNTGVQGFNVFGSARFESVNIDGNNLLQYSIDPDESMGNEATIRLTNPLTATASGLTHIHFDLWYAGPVDDQSAVYVELWNNPSNWEIVRIDIDQSSNPQLLSDTWLSVDLALENIGAGEFNAIQDLDISFPNLRRYGQIYLDNIYFYNKFPNSSPSLPIDFEAETSVSSVINADQGVTVEIVSNPDMSGINTSNNVLAFTKAQNSDDDSGFFNLFAENLNLSTERAISFKLWAPKVGAKIKVQLESSDGTGSQSITLIDTIQKANEWIRFTVNLDELIEPQALYDKLTIIPDIDSDAGQGDGAIYYFDDIGQYNSDQFWTIDVAFEQALFDKAIDEGPLDGLMQISRVRAITDLNLSGEPDGVLNNQTDPAGLGIVSLDGIQFFEGLENLRIEGNQIKKVDLSNNLRLIQLRAWRNGLEEINLDGLDDLEFLGLNFNNVGSIDLSQNGNLETVGLSANNLTSIQLPPQSTKLRRLELFSNKLEGLDISGIDSFLDVLLVNDNPNLSCIELSNLEILERSRAWQVDDGVSFSENCNGTSELLVDKPVVRISLRSPNNQAPFPVNNQEESGSFLVDESENLFEVDFEILFPEGFENTDIPLEISFLVEAISSEYAIDKNPVGDGDFFLDLTASTVSNTIQLQLIESDSGVSSVFPLTPNGNPQLPDATLVFRLVNDSSFEATLPTEEILFTVFEDLGNTYVLENARDDGKLLFPVRIEDDDSKEFLLSIQTNGGLESTEELVTIELLRKSLGDGIPPEPYILQDEDGPLDFSIELLPGNPQGNATAAEVGDYSLENGETSVRVPVGSSSGSFLVNYNSDSDAENEVYQIALSLQESAVFDSTNLSVPGPVSVRIIDADGPFNVLVEAPFAKQSGIDLYQVNEGETFEVLFTAESGAPLEELYTVEVTLANPFANPIESQDVSIGNPLNGGLVTFENSNSIESKLNVVINSGDDDDEEANEGIEQFELRLASRRILRTNQEFQFIEKNTGALINELIFPIQIIDVLPASIRATGSRILVDEDSENFAEYVISLAEENTTGKDIQVGFKVSDDSEAQVGDSELKDFVFSIAGNSFAGNEGFVTIPPGERQAEVKVLPNSDKIPEQNEKVILELRQIEGEGYFLSEDLTDFPQSAQIEILDDDEVNFNAIITTLGNKFAFENNDGGPQSGFFRISLDKPNNTTEEIRVRFKVDFMSTNSAIRGVECAEGIDYYLNTGTDGDFVLIPPNALFVDVEVIPCDDSEVEITEEVKLTLIPSEEGVNVFNAGMPSSAEIEIASDECETDAISPTDLKVTAISASCIRNVSGAIVVENNSCLDFTVNIRNTSFNRSISLPGISTDTIQNLEFGRYVIEFENLTNDIIPPSFEVNVEPFEDLTVGKVGVDNNRKIGTIQVSGSTSYEVSIDQDIFRFAFEDSRMRELEIPLKKGRNNLVIKGSSECQGSVQKTLILGRIIAVPNPVIDVVEVIGLQSKKEVNVNLYSLTGQLVFNQKRIIVNQSLELDLSTLEAGTYLGVIQGAEGAQEHFKVIVK